MALKPIQIQIHLYLIFQLASFCAAGERGPSPLHQAPSYYPSPLVAEVQTDNFSCGYHSLSAIYKSHGLDPAKAKLRVRLGTSVGAIPFVKDSTGTLQPDMFRVLMQDGFQTSSIDKFTGQKLKNIQTHLEGRRFVLALFKTDRPGGMHWAVFTEFNNGKVTVADSLEKEPYQVVLNTFAEEKLLNAVLLYPSTPQPDSPYYLAHFKGSKSMLISGWAGTPILRRLIGVAIVLAIIAGLILLVKKIRSSRNRSALQRIVEL